MKATFLLVIAMAATCFGSLVAGEEGMRLPPPQMTGGEGIFDAINRRASGASFAGPVSNSELSTILWAATGRNRNDGGWTVPMAMGRPPYCKVYVVGANGAFLYDWQNHSLDKVTEGDVRDRIGMQGFAKTAYYNLLLVVDAATVKKISKQEADAVGGYAVGAMTQNIYLAADALDLKTRFVMSVNKDETKKALELGEDDQIACIMVLGKG